MNKKITKISNRLFIIGALLIIVSPLVFAFVPPLLTDTLCGTSTTDLRCGYKNLGIEGYALYIALVPAILGLIAIITGIILNKK